MDELTFRKKNKKIRVTGTLKGYLCALAIIGIFFSAVFYNHGISSYGFFVVFFIKLHVTVGVHFELSK